MICPELPIEKKRTHECYIGRASSGFEQNRHCRMDAKQGHRS